MRKFAIIIDNIVVDIENSEYIPVLGPTAGGLIPQAIPCDDAVELGMVYDPETNTFSEYIPPEPIPPQPTQLDNIEATQLTIMTAMAEQYEESLERELTNMEVQATIYEAILEMGGAE